MHVGLRHQHVPAGRARREQGLGGREDLRACLELRGLLLRTAVGEGGESVFVCRPWEVGYLALRTWVEGKGGSSFGTYSAVEKRTKGDESEKACTCAAVQASNVVAIVSCIVVL